MSLLRVISEAGTAMLCKLQRKNCTGNHVVSVYMLQHRGVWGGGGA